MYWSFNFDMIELQEHSVQNALYQFIMPSTNFSDKLQ